MLLLLVGQWVSSGWIEPLTETKYKDFCYNRSVCRLQHMNLGYSLNPDTGKLIFRIQNAVPISQFKNWEQSEVGEKVREKITR
jgi:hypothetical protein